MSGTIDTITGDVSSLIDIGNGEELSKEDSFPRNNDLVHNSKGLDPITEGEISLQSIQEISAEQAGYLSGRWTTEEHEIFLGCLQQYGREWKKIAYKIPTRTPAQIRSHAQKYLSKLSKMEGQVLTNASMRVTGEKLKKKRCKISAKTLEKIEQIKNNPSAVEDEVKSTLESLYRMYNNLLGALESRSTKTSLQNPNANKKPRQNKNAMFGHNIIDIDDKKTENDIRRQILQHRELRGQELIAIQVLGTCLNTTNSKNGKNNSNDTAQLRQKRSYDECFDRL